MVRMHCLSLLLAGTAFATAACRTPPQPPAPIPSAASDQGNLPFRFVQINPPNIPPERPMPPDGPIDLPQPRERDLPRVPAPPDDLPPDYDPPTTQDIEPPSTQESDNPTTHPATDEL